MAAQRGECAPLGAQDKHPVTALGRSAPLHDILAALAQAPRAVRQRGRRGGFCKVHPNQRLGVAREHSADQRLDRRIQEAHVDVSILRAVYNAVAAGEDDVQGRRRLLVHSDGKKFLTGHS